jgi:hypothetical protein
MSQQISGELTPPSNSDDPNPPPRRRSKSGQITRALLLHIWEPIDAIGEALTGSFWRTICLNTQDAIALALALQVPSLLGRLIIGKDFSAFDVCLGENPLGVSRYACYLIVMSDFALWIILAGRVIARSLVDIREAIGGLIQSIRNRR